MKIYLAGKWEEHELIKTYADRLRAVGHTITLPWFEMHLGSTPFPQAAREDVQGVLDADACVFIFERELAYAGALVELGIAIGTNKAILIVGPAMTRCVFTSIIERVDTFDKVNEWLTAQEPPELHSTSRCT